MSRDYIDLGSAPANEDCAQVGTPDYHARARPECVRFIELLRKTFGPEPMGAQMAIRANPHDFGSYLSVICYYETTSEAAVEYAYRCEDQTPSTWKDPDADEQRPAAPPVDRVCDSCLAAAEEEGIPDRTSQEMVMLELGSDLPDHLCDQVGDPDLGFRCLCGCRRR